MAAQPQPAISPWTGTLKTFGEYGPMYEVLGSVGAGPNGQEMVSIRVFGTGEVLDYSVDELKSDPEAV